MIKPLRILHLLNKLIRGGAETWLLHILRRIDRDQFQFDFLVHDPSPGMYDAEVRTLGAQIICCPYPSWAWNYAYDYTKILKEKGPYDIVHGHLARCGFQIYFAYQMGIPVKIAHSHNDDILRLKDSNYLRRLGLGLSNLLISRYADVGLAASRLAARGRFGPNWESDQRWRILYCAIDLAPFRETIDAKAVRQEWGIPEEAFVIGHVGAFDPQKNHGLIVDIIAEMAHWESNFRVLLVGDGKLRHAIEGKVARLGLQDKFIFTGVRPDVPRLMLGGMDVFLFPSLFEGLPLVLMEAQAAGIPCIISNTITEEAEVIKPLIQRRSLEDSPADWARTLIATKGTPTITQAAALKFMEQSQFNIQVSCSQLIKLYTEAIGQSRYPTHR